MAVALANVLTGLRNRLKGDSTFNTALGGSASTTGRIWFNTADRAEDFPFCVFSMIDSVSADTMDKDGYVMRVQFSMYEETDAGPAALYAIGDKLRARMHRERITVSGHQQYVCDEDIVRGPFRDGDVWRLDADYTISGFAS